MPRRAIRAAEISQHASRESLWLVIEGQVYDVTGFAPAHPGGPAVLLRYAGSDATDAYLPVHPPGTLDQLSEDNHLGWLADPEALKTPLAREGDPLSLRDQAVPSLEHILNLHDMEGAAEKKLSSKAWAYYRSAADQERAYRGNERSWQLITMRPRVLRRAKGFTAQTTILRHPVSSPVIIGPAALARLADPEGERALCRAAALHGMIYCMSANASLRPEDVAQVARPGQILFYQIYLAADRRQSIDLLRRVTQLGFKAIVFTVDSIQGGKRTRDERAALSTNFVALDAPPSLSASGLQKEAEKQQSVTNMTAAYFDQNIGWSDVAFIRKHTDLPIILKGINTAEDACLACEHDVQGIWVSNHGGRNLEDTPGPAHVLLELQMHAPHVFKRMDVFVDGGVRNGVDVLKALCLGAKAVAIARPFMYGLVYGEEGVSKVAALIDGELASSSRLLGVTRLDQLRSDLINTRRLEAEVPMKLKLPGRRWWQALARL